MLVWDQLSDVSDLNIAPEEKEKCRTDPKKKKHLCFCDETRGNGSVKGKAFFSNREETEVLMNLWPFFVNMHSDSSCELNMQYFK